MEVIDLSQEHCGMYRCCYEEGKCEDKCIAGFKEFIKVCEADRKMKQMEREGRVYRP